MPGITKIFMLLAVLLGSQDAYAENDAMTGLPLPANQNPPNRPVSHVDYLGNSFLTAARLQARERTTLEETKAGNAKAIGPNENSSVGLHWMVETQHPTLELRLSNQSAIRFHTSRHGGSIAAGWKF